MALAGCGANNDKQKAVDLQQQGEQLRQESAKLQKEAQQTAEDVKNGKISAAAASKKLEAKTEALKTKARETTQKAIDAAKGNSNLTAKQRQELENAQQQLQASP